MAAIGPLLGESLSERSVPSTGIVENPSIKTRSKKRTQNDGKKTKKPFKKIKSNTLSKGSRRKTSRKGTTGTCRPGTVLRTRGGRELAKAVTRPSGCRSGVQERLLRGIAGTCASASARRGGRHGVCALECARAGLWLQTSLDS